MVHIQQSYGDVGLLVYMNEDNEVKSRLFSYEEKDKDVWIEEVKQLLEQEGYQYEN